MNLFVAYAPLRFIIKLHLISVHFLNKEKFVWHSIEKIMCFMHFRAFICEYSAQSFHRISHLVLKPENCHTMI